MRFEYADGRLPVAMKSGGTTYFLTYDQVGSLRVVADASANVVELIEYDSFGNIINDTNSTIEVPFGFAGGLYDNDTGLVRFGERDYDSETGRWTAKDPIRFEGKDTNLYGYVLSDPVNRKDINGKDPYKDYGMDKCQRHLRTRHLTALKFCCKEKALKCKTCSGDSRACRDAYKRCIAEQA